LYASLIGFNPRRLKAPKGDELPRNGPSCLCEIFFFCRKIATIGRFLYFLTDDAASWL